MRPNVGGKLTNAEFLRPNRNVTAERPRDTVWWRDVSAEGPRDGINIETTRCRLLCHDLDCGAEFFVAVSDLK